MRMEKAVQRRATMKQTAVRVVALSCVVGSLVQVGEPKHVILFASAFSIVGSSRTRTALFAPPPLSFLSVLLPCWSDRVTRPSRLCIYSPSSHRDDFDEEEEDDDDDDDDDEDDLIDPTSLGDWRTFRRNLAASFGSSSSSSSTGTTNVSSDHAPQQLPPPQQSLSQQPSQQGKKQQGRSPLPRARSVSKENEALLRTQCEKLAKEYVDGVWAHTTSTPEVGGLVVRLPLEAEIFRNHRHSLNGRKLRQQRYNSDDDVTITDATSPAVWYAQAKRLVEREMLAISRQAGDRGGQIEASALDAESAELLQMYLDNQESWQEVCLVVQRNEATGSTTTLVLNRPMALKLTENLALLVLFGAYRTQPNVSKRQPSSTTAAPAPSSSSPPTSPQALAQQRRDEEAELIKFLIAFGQECAVYIGGPDGQDQPAQIIHGRADLPGAVEIAPGTGLYVGGDRQAMMNGVLRGIYKPMDFRFFVGRHVYDQSMLDVNVVLGKYQPVACARTLALKQCISLPKPLWHEVLELCDGEMKEISKLELLKRDDLRYRIVDDDDDDDLNDDGVVDELKTLDDDNEDDDENLYA